MRIATSVDLVISADTMHQHVAGSVALKAMMHMLLDKLDRGARAVYPDATEARVHFQKYFTIEYTNTIADYQYWHLFATVDHREDVEELVFP